MTGKKQNILIVAAHPDDEILGCGGTAARLSMEGQSVHILILGEGITSRSDKRDRRTKAAEINGLKKSAAAAGRIVGVDGSYLCDFPDNRFDTVPLLDIVKTVEQYKKDLRPDAVFTHHRGDLNIDHRITFKAVLTAFRPINGERARAIYSFEVPSSTEWGAPSPGTSFTPNFFVDITDTLELKIKAMRRYVSEVREFPHPRSKKAMRITGARWGIQVGCSAAEAFEVVRMIR